MEGWGKIGVQSASVLYPNSCYNESCYIEVQVYFHLVEEYIHEHNLVSFDINFLEGGKFVGTLQKLNHMPVTCQIIS